MGYNLRLIWKLNYKQNGHSSTLGKINKHLDLR
jgi:hypothetical protein